MLKFAKEHHQEILSIADKLCECLGFKKTAEFIRVVQFVANYVEQVAAAMEKTYNEDLQAAWNSQGQNFNRKQFDHEYGVQGKSMENFIRSVLENYNTYELIPVLKAAYQRMFSLATQCEMSEQQIDMQKFAKEHYQKILSIAVELCKSLGFKKTAEFIRVEQFVANYVEQVAAAMEKRYNEDLQAAQNSQGQNFNREQFDHEYRAQGKSTKNFISSVLENYNTIKVILVLKAEYQRIFPPKENPSDTEGNAEDGSVVTENNSHTSLDSNLDGEGEVVCTDASSVTNVCSFDETTGADQEADVLYKKHRDFNKYGDLSDNEIYMIVQEVTGLYLYEGNSGLYRHSEATYVSVTDPHIEPLTVIISSNKHNNTVTACLIV
jgi:sortase (surface protein transpeptidase)